MSSIEENIATLSNAILDEAKADAIRQRALEQAAAERKEILDRATQESERIRGQAMATAQLRARTLQLGHRETLLQSVFVAARKDLSSVLKWSEYDTIARRLLSEAIVQLGSNEVKIHTDAVTAKYLSASVVAGVV